MSTEEAIARAKAIAARLAGSAAAASLTPDSSAPSSYAVGNVNVTAVADAALAAAASANGGSKRKRWGTESGTVSTASIVDDALAQAMNTKRMNTGTGIKKLMIPQEKYPGYNFIGLLIGPGGSKQRELVAQSGGNVKISIRGKGSSTSNLNPNQADDPLHVLLEGQQENVDNAEKLISDLLNDPEKAQAEKDRQLAVVGASSGGSGYTPKPVSQIIGVNGGGHYGPSAGAEVIEEKIGIPNGFVGYIIGKGGESITSMQRKSGCRVQIQKEPEMEPGSTQRIITLTGATPEAVSMCRGIIEEMVQERARLNEQSRGGGSTFSGLGPGSNAAAQAVQLQKALSEGQALVTVAVPNNDVGLVIGKGGMTIRSIQERSGANIQIPQGPDHNNPAIRSVNITHPQKEGAEFAKTLLEEVLNSKAQSSGGGGYGGGNASDANIQVQIPDQDVGMCIGKSGCVIREMQQRTQTRIQIPSQPTPGQMYRLATVTGPSEGCQKVQEIINRISVEQSSQFVMTGECFQPNHGHGYDQYNSQQHGAAAGGQQGDYSAQWAAYYAAQGTTATAQSTNGAVSATGATNTSTQGQQGQQAADSYHEDFFRYSYHYGEDAARKAYGAWSPPVGTANPYGTNPSLSSSGTSAPTPNPDGGASPAKTPTPAARESSVRGVSNLPAWMTKG